MNFAQPHSVIQALKTVKIIEFSRCLTSPRSHRYGWPAWSERGRGSRGTFTAPRPTNSRKRGFNTRLAVSLLLSTLYSPNQWAVSPSTSRGCLFATAFRGRFTGPWLFLHLLPTKLGTDRPRESRVNDSPVVFLAYAVHLLASPPGVELIGPLIHFLASGNRGLPRARDQHLPGQIKMPRCLRFFAQGQPLRSS